jgi:hypothetical protein
MQTLGRPARGPRAFTVLGSHNVPEAVAVAGRGAARPVARNATALVAEAAAPSTASAISSGLPEGVPVGLAVAGGVALAAYGLKQARAPCAACCARR